MIEDDDSADGAMQGETFAVLMALLMLLLCIAKFEVSATTSPPPSAPAPQITTDPVRENTSPPEPVPMAIQIDPSALQDYLNQIKLLTGDRDHWKAVADSTAKSLSSATGLLQSHVQNPGQLLPPNASLQSSKIFPAGSYKSGAYWLTSDGQSAVRNELAELLKIANSYKSDILEVIGHTDGMSYASDRKTVFFENSITTDREFLPGLGFRYHRRDIRNTDPLALDFDKTLHLHLESGMPLSEIIYYKDHTPGIVPFYPQTQYWIMSNTELGMARAVAVASYIKSILPEESAIRSIQVLSAGQFQDLLGGLTSSEDSADRPLRRRIDLRLNYSSRFKN